MAKKKQETLVLFQDMVSATEILSDAQLGALMRGIFTYRFAETEPEFDDPIVNISFRFVKPQLDRYEEFCEIKRANGRKAKHSKKEETEEKETEPVTCSENESNQSEPKVTKSEQTAAHTHTHTHNHNHNYNHNHNHTHTQSHIHTPIYLESVGGEKIAAPTPDWQEGKEASMINKEDSS